MKAIILIFLIAACSQAIVIPHLGPAHQSSIPRYNISIHASSKERWGPIIADFKQNLTSFIDLVNKFVPIPKVVWEVIGLYGESFYKLEEWKFTKDIQTIADLMDLKFGEVFALNFLYEISSLWWNKECTGIIYRNAEGKIIHGRNLDFEFWTTFAGLSFVGDFYDKHNNLIYSAEGVAGAAFFHTGIRHGKFSINVNSRYEGNFKDLLGSILHGDMPSSHLLQVVLEEEKDFKSAVKKLSNTRLDSPIYYIVGGVGPNEGVVIERHKEGVNAMYQLNDTNWFLVQTNYDRDQVDPWTDRRRYPAEERMKELGQNMTEADLLNNVLAKWPNLNIATIVSTIMCPADSYTSSVKWY